MHNKQIITAYNASII